MIKTQMLFSGIPLLLYDPANVGNSISGSTVFSKPRLDIKKFLVGVMLKPNTQVFKHNLTSMGDMYNYQMV